MTEMPAEEATAIFDNGLSSQASGPDVFMSMGGVDNALAHAVAWIWRGMHLLRWREQLENRGRKFSGDIGWYVICADIGWYALLLIFKPCNFALNTFQDFLFTYFKHKWQRLCN